MGDDERSLSGKTALYFVLCVFIILVVLSFETFLIAKATAREDAALITQGISIDVITIPQEGINPTGRVSGAVYYSWSKGNLYHYGSSILAYNDWLTNTSCRKGYNYDEQEALDSFKELSKYGLEHTIATSNKSWGTKEVKEYLEDKYEGLKVLYTELNC